ncbi:MAG TPA: TRAM domain-containing protein [Trebonia sp.]|nr:TRAM domain-containing protein [Trebonia sp.]
MSDAELAYAVGQTVEVTAVDVAQGGWCVARPEGLPVLFVRHALPGERVLARVTEVTSRFARADAIEVREASPDRVEPPCPSAHPGGCGGCDWQHASLPAQRALKAAVIAQQLRRVAGLELDTEITVEALPGDEGAPGQPAGTPETTVIAGTLTATVTAMTAEATEPGLGWRTRVQFAVRPDGLAGLRAHRSHEVVDIGDCPIAHPAIRDLGLLDYSWEGAGTVEAAAGSPEQGHQDRVVILTKAGRAPRGRRAPGSVPGRRAPRDERGRDARARSEDRAVELFPQEAVDSVEAEAVLIRSAHRLTPVRGRQYLTQFAAGRHWQVNAGGFWQVHPAAADALSEAVVGALEPKPGDTALDLYAGAGLFAGVLAPLVGEDGSVTAIESDAAAVRDARANLDVYPWVRVHRNDVALAVADRGLPQARLVVADPPRAGLAREVVDYLIGDSGAARFAYVSCDPATLARDLGLLIAGGWRVDGLRAFDAFPMTHHVECVVTLSR